MCRWTKGWNFLGFAGANSTTGLVEILQELRQLQDRHGGTDEDHLPGLVNVQKAIENGHS